jgi:UDP-GlcNAc3NAcA epimerase
MPELLTVVGARPQFIKASAISRCLQITPGISEILIHTGQHYDQEMSDIFFRELDIPKPKYNLGIGSASHGMQTGQMLVAIEEILIKESPSMVIVYGDTNSTLAGALAAAKLHIPVAHIEAGLRSWNRQMPEEINRVLTDHASDILLAPTKLAIDNLLKEGIDRSKTFLVGDVMYDVALNFLHKAEQASKIINKLRLNTDNVERLDNIFNALCLIAENIEIVLPLHPRTRKLLKNIGLFDKVSKHLKVIEPVGYLDMIALESKAQIIVTDSGGIQKEAFFNQVPCVVLRNETEWQELIDLGCNKLVPPDSVESIKQGIFEHLSMGKDEILFPHIYGEGYSAEKILDILLKFIS